VLHNILIVDSNRSLLASHQSLLLQAGYKVAIAQNISAASMHLRSTLYSLVIAELALPESDPIDEVNLIRQVRTLRPGTPILVLTSNTNPASHRRARDLGVWDISIKPTPSTELLSLAKNILHEAYPEHSV